MGGFKIPLSLILLSVFFFSFNAKLNAQYVLGGPSLLCTSGQYSVQNYTSEQIYWFSSSNLTLTSTQGQHPATFSANGNGLGWVAKTITCCGNQYTDTIPVWIGSPIIEWVADEGKYPEQHLYDCSFWPPYWDISEPEYSLDVDSPGEVWYCDQSWAQVYLPGDPSQYSFLLISTNTCGYDWTVFYWNEIWDDK